MKYNNYIFDFDGTLVDSMPYWSEKMLNILKKNNIQYPVDIIKIITPLGDVGTARYFMEKFDIQLSVEQMLAQMEDYAFPKYRDIIELKKGVAEYLTMLKNNHCSINILTASPHKMVDVCLKRIGIFDLFDNVWTCEDFGLTKSDLQIYVQASNKLNTSISNIAFFDDNIEAISVAKKAGLYTVGVYDETGKDFSYQLKKTANRYIESFEGFDML